MRLRRQSNAEVLTVDTNAPLGKGGEARVYAVSGSPQLAAKVYEADKDLTERIAKLTVMRDLPPDVPEGKDGHVSIAWPLDLLCDADDAGRVTGFLMGRVQDAAQVIDVYNPQTRLIECPLFDYRYLLRTARNLAAAVRALHARGYVIGDLKHSNVLVTQTALVTLVDADSFQVRDPQTGHVYACPVHTPDFTPPEMQEEGKREEGKGKREEIQDTRYKIQVGDEDSSLFPSHDLFALAVLIFHLLMEGTHPFAGVYLEEGDPPPFEERIARGHFPYGNRAVPYRANTRYAPPFELLPPALRELFVRCFEEGHDNPDLRPDARTWQRALDEAGRNLLRCDANPQHFYGNHLDACPWCLRKQTQLRGLDPFPSEQAVRERERLKAPTPNSIKPVNPYNEAYPPSPDTPAAPTSMDSGAAAWLICVGFVVLISVCLVVVSNSSHEQNVDTTTSGIAQTTPEGSSSASSDDPSATSQNSASARMQRAFASPFVPNPPAAPAQTIWQVATSPDGKTILGSGSAIVLWDARTGKARRAFPNGGRFTHCFAYSPDGATLAIPDSKGVVSLWDMQTGKRRITLAGSASYSTVLFSHDGKLLAAAKYGWNLDSHSSICVWDAQTGKKAQAFDTGARDIPRMAFSPIDDTLVSFVEPSVVVGVHSQMDVWNARTGHRYYHRDKLAPIIMAAFSRDGKTIIADGSPAHRWNVKTGLPTTPAVYPLSNSGFVFSPRETRVANLLSETHEVAVLGTADATRLCVLPLLKADSALKADAEASYVGYTSAAFDPTGNRLVTGSYTQGAQVWDARTGKLLRTLEGQKGEMRVTASGLKIVDLVKGTGALPRKGQRLTVHYVGKFADSTTFDTSRKHGQPFVFTLGKDEVIRGWEEGIATMRVGGTRRLIIPLSLGYGSAGVGNAIPPDAMLQFDVHLLKAESVAY